MLFNLGETRSSLKADHLLQTPDTFIRIPLPNASKVEFVVHCGPRIGAKFTQMTAEFAAGGRMGASEPGIQRFVYVLEGALSVTMQDASDQRYSLTQGQHIYIPAGIPHWIEAENAAKAVVIEKVYQPSSGTAVGELEVVTGDEAGATSEPLGGDPNLQVRRLMPDGPLWDFAVNTITYAPGATLALTEIHVMEHGLLMLEGGGIYKLGDYWYPVTAGDFIWMGPYCPQWFGALGKTPAKYLIYKDWYRHPLEMSTHDLRPYAGNR